MIAKFKIKKVVYLFFFVAILIVPAFSLSFAQVLLSTDIQATIGSATFEERDIIYYDASSFSLHLSGSDLRIPDGVNIDAFGYSQGDILFSVDIPISLNGVVYTERDLILYDGTNFIKLFDGSAIGIPEGARIDAATVLSGGNIVFSTDIPVSLEGISFKANDLIVYDGFSSSLHFSGSDSGIPESANIDGVWVNLEGEILFSLDIPCNLNGLEIKDKDIVKWSEGSFSLYIDGLSAEMPAGADVDALSSVNEPCEGDFDDDSDVDGSDLAVFAADFGRTDCGSDCDGDFDENGDVDECDLAAFAAAFGRTACPICP